MTPIGTSCSTNCGPWGEKQVLKSYNEVPEEIVEDQEELASWAREAAARRGTGKASAKKKG